MKNFILLIVLIVFISWNVNAQSIKQREIEAKEVIENVLEEYFTNKIQESSFIIYSFDFSKHLIIFERADYFDEYFVLQNYRKELIDTSHARINKSESEIKYLFDSNNYRQDFVTTDSDFYETNDLEFVAGGYSYFYLLQNGKKFGEFALPIFTQPHPLDKKLHSLLLERLTNYFDIQSE